MANDETLQGRVKQLEAKLAELLGRRCDNCRFCALANRSPDLVYCEMETKCHSIHRLAEHCADGPMVTFFSPADHYCSYWEKDEREFEDSACSLVYGWKHTKTCRLVLTAQAREASPPSPRCSHGRGLCPVCHPCDCGAKERRAMMIAAWMNRKYIPWDG